MRRRRSAVVADAIVRSGQAVIDASLEHPRSDEAPGELAEVEQRKRVGRVHVETAMTHRRRVQRRVDHEATRGQPERASGIALNQGAGRRHGGRRRVGDAGVQDGVRAQTLDRVLQLDVPPVDRQRRSGEARWITVPRATSFPFPGVRSIAADRRFWPAVRRLRLTTSRPCAEKPSGAVMTLAHGSLAPSRPTNWVEQSDFRSETAR